MAVRSRPYTCPSANVDAPGVREVQITLIDKPSEHEPKPRNEQLVFAVSLLICHASLPLPLRRAWKTSDWRVYFCYFPVSLTILHLRFKADFVYFLDHKLIDGFDKDVIQCHSCPSQSFPSQRIQTSTRCLAAGLEKRLRTTFPVCSVNPVT